MPAVFALRGSIYIFVLSGAGYRALLGVLSWVVIWDGFVGKLPPSVGCLEFPCSLSWRVLPLAISITSNMSDLALQEKKIGESFFGSHESGPEKLGLSQVKAAEGVGFDLGLFRRGSRNTGIQPVFTVLGLSVFSSGRALERSARSDSGVFVQPNTPRRLSKVGSRIARCWRRLQL